MVEQKKPHYGGESRGYKTKGYSYKDRYVKDKPCPECGGLSAYRDEWNTQISYKCMKRSCRYNWFEPKVPSKVEVPKPKSIDEAAETNETSETK